LVFVSTQLIETTLFDILRTGSAGSIGILVTARPSLELLLTTAVFGLRAVPSELALALGPAAPRVRTASAGAVAIFDLRAVHVRTASSEAIAADTLNLATSLVSEPSKAE
jgi:hypothetical protein